MRSRSHDICPLDMYTLQSFHTSNIVDLLHKVYEKQTKTQKLNYNHWTMKMRSRSDDTCQLDMYTLQSFHTPNILDLLLIVSEIRLDHKNLTLFTDPWNEVEVKWKLSDGHEDLVMQGMHIPNIVILLLIIRENLTLQKMVTFFQVVTEPWKWGQGHWTSDWRKLLNIRHPYTNYEASRSSTF